MKSRTSCCNGTLLRRVLSRSALLWGIYLMGWLVLLPVNVLSDSVWREAMDLKELVLDYAAGGSHTATFFYGLAVAWVLFLYLHRSRSANFFAALPIRRETMFGTHYLAGLLCAVVPNFLVMGATMLAGFACGVNLIMESAVWFAANTLGYVFYFSLAVFCTMLVGNLIAMPCLYVIVNFTAAVVEAAGRSLLQSLIYGFWYSGNLGLGFLSPFYHAVLDGNGPDCRTKFVDGELTAVWFEGWPSLLILAAVGIVFAALAFLLHQRRRMEAAGDVMAIRPLKPVFLYVFTCGCAVVGGALLSEVVVNDMDSRNFLLIALCVVGCTAAGYFLGEMILLRTMRVFRKRNLLRCAVCVAVAAAALICIRLDVLGVESYVPDAAEVAGVRLDGSRTEVTDPGRIDQVLALHQEIIQRKRETEQLCRQEVWDPRMEITYVLQSGRTVTRYYRLPVLREQENPPDSLIVKYEQVLNTPEMILARELPRQEMTVSNIRSCLIHYVLPDTHYGESIGPGAAEAYRLWTEAMLPDFRAANMGGIYHSYRPEEEIASTYSDVAVEFELEHDGDVEYYYYHIPDTAVLTMEALIELGVPEESFFLEKEK